MYGRPLLLQNRPPSNSQLGEYVPTLSLIHHLLREQADQALPKPHEGSTNQKRSSTMLLLPGKHVFLKTLNLTSPRSKWEAPFQIMLTIPTAAKLSRHASWYQLSRLKRAPTTDPPTTDPPIAFRQFSSTLFGPTKLCLMPVHKGDT